MTLTILGLLLAAVTVQFPLAWLRRACLRRGWRGCARLAYRAYLATPWWHAIARATKRRARWRCEACGRRTYRLQAHHAGHAAYALLAREWTPWRGLTRLLRALDDDCHRTEHGK